MFGLKRLEYKLSCITLPALPVYIVRFTLRESPCTRRSAHVSPSNIVYIMTGRVCTHTCTPSESQMKRVRRTGKMRKGNRDRVGPACVYIRTYFCWINCWRSRVIPVGVPNALLLSPDSLCVLYKSDYRKKNNAGPEINAVYGAAIYIAHHRWYTVVIY